MTDTNTPASVVNRVEAALAADGVLESPEIRQRINVIALTKALASQPTPNAEQPRDDAPHLAPWDAEDWSAKASQPVKPSVVELLRDAREYIDSLLTRIDARLNGEG